MDIYIKCREKKMAVCIFILYYQRIFGYELKWIFIFCLDFICRISLKGLKFHRNTTILSCAQNRLHQIATLSMPLQSVIANDLWHFPP